MRFLFSYRGNEIWVEVEAKHEAEAYEKVRRGEVIPGTEVIEYSVMWPEFWELQDEDYE